MLNYTKTIRVNTKTPNPGVRGMILASGFGTRLRPLTLFRAKPATPFLNRPLVDYSIELLQRAAVKEIVINLHHLPDSVVEAVGKKRPGIHFSYEEEILGTAGAIGRVRDFLAGETFIVSNGKIYFEENLSHALAFHRETHSMVTLILVPYSPEDLFNPVFMDEQHHIVGFGGKGLVQANSETPFVFTGIHILEPCVFDFIPDSPSDIVRDIYPRLIQAGHPMRGFVSRAYWCECSLPSRYLSNSLEVLRRKGLQNLLDSEIEASCRHVVAGRKIKVGKSSLLESCILWDDVQIGRNSSLRNVIIAGTVKLPAQTHLEDVVVTPLPQEGPSPARGSPTENHQVWPLK